MRVTVETKEDGETGLKLESLADELRVKPKKEDPAEDVVKKPAVKKAAAKKPVAPKPKPAPKGPDGAKRSLVPQLPRKG